ncbi:MAG: HU family DNA-binding protein [Bacteroidota bacterium]
MNKGDLVSKIAEKTGLSKSQSSEALNATLDAVSEALKDGDKVTLIGFGTFSLSLRKERPGRNPQTGATITIPAKVSAKFKPGKELSEAVDTPKLVKELS